MPSRHATPSARSSRGTSLLEAVIALAILLIGIAGTMQLQVFGITANAGARANTQAFQLAREMAQALSQLSPADPLLAFDFRAEAPPPEFGQLQFNPTAPHKVWADGMLPSVTTDARIRQLFGADNDDAAQPFFQRRWQVWQMPNASAAAAPGGGLNVVAVSVNYREAKLPGRREVVLLTQVSNKGLSASFVSAYR